MTADTARSHGLLDLLDIPYQGAGVLGSAVAIPYASSCGGEGPGNVPNQATGWGEIDALEAAGIAGATGRHVLRAPFAGEALVLHAVRGERVDQLPILPSVGVSYSF